MSSSRSRAANGQHQTSNDADDSFDNDSSTAMSLDESSIHLNATAASHNISVDMTTGTSFSRRGGSGNNNHNNHGGGGRRGNASPAFSPFATDSSSMRMSISGMDNTPSSHQMNNNNNNNVNGGTTSGPKKPDINNIPSIGKPPLNFNGHLGNGKKILQEKNDDPSSTATAAGATSTARWN